MYRREIPESVSDEMRECRSRAQSGTEGDSEPELGAKFHPTHSGRPLARLEIDSAPDKAYSYL
jgi:hypothetical protein